MASKIVYVDFRGGMIDERMRRRTDIQGYYNSASLIENAVPTSTGGIKLRPGLVKFSDDIEAERIIQFTESVDKSYAIVLSEKKARIFGIKATGELGDISGVYQTEYLKSEIKDIQYAQDYERIVLVHENHPPFVIEINKISGGFSAGNIVLDPYRNETRIDNDESSKTLYDYDGLFTKKDFPSAVAFMSQRLWFMASKEHSYRLWASRAFKYNNFQKDDYFQRIDESTTVEEYLKAISGNKTTTEIMEDGNTKRVETKVSPDGIVTETTTILTPDGDIVSQETKAWSYTKPKYSWEKVVREDCSIELDLASDRDQRVSWIGFAGDRLFVGTASSEWAIPSNISAINAYTTQLNSYGSAKNKQCVYGSNALFYIQSGAKKIRAINTASDGLSFSDITYQCESITKDGISEMHWQRVPFQRLYAVLKNGNIAVLSYDPEYGINAWCIWKSNIRAISMCIMDSEDGQIPLLLGEDKNGTRAVYRFDDNSFLDNGVPFKAIVTTNNIEGDGTIPYVKKNFNLYIDSMNTEFKAMQDGYKALTPRSFDNKLIKLDAYSASTLDGLRITIESIDGKPFEILAFAVEVEVS